MPDTLSALDATFLELEQREGGALMPARSTTGSRSTERLSRPARAGSGGSKQAPAPQGAAPGK